MQQADARAARVQAYSAPALAAVLAAAAGTRSWSLILRGLLIALMVGVIALTVLVSMWRSRAAIAAF